MTAITLYPEASQPDGASPLPGLDPARGPWSVRELCLDWGERALVLGLFGWLVQRLITSIWLQGNVANLLLLVSEGLVVVFILIRRRASVTSRNPAEWALALAVTSLPMAVSAGGTPVAPLGVAAAVMLVGMFVQIHAKITLGRSFGMVPANRGLKVRGPYRFLRHPMYAGYLITHVAFLLANPTWWNLGIYLLANGLQIIRLLAEERLLTRDEQYRAYRLAVPYRLVPGMF
jgi:protein-S-isoprenylcysteine O-methyltransferase Ste14